MLLTRRTHIQILTSLAVTSHALGDFQAVAGENIIHLYLRIVDLLVSRCGLDESVHGCIHTYQCLFLRVETRVFSNVI